jgi:hypothetical protein
MPSLRCLLRVMGATVISLQGMRAGAQSDSIAAIPSASVDGVTAKPSPLSDGTARRRSPLSEAALTVSGDSVDRWRLSELDGSVPQRGLTLRSTSSLSDPRRYGHGPRRFTIVSPYLKFIGNSELPFGQNEGALWVGKGANLRAMAGFTGTFGPVRIVAIPEIVYSANSALSITPMDSVRGPQLPSSRSPFSSPFNVYPYSIDLPYRFGPTSVSRLYPGQSSITITAGPVEAGAATENEWWGPAVRNPIVLGDNAPGFPHGFIRTNGELSGPLGLFEARFILGGLHESDFFDDDFTNDVRSISALAVAWRPSLRSDVTLGLTRAVIAPASGYSDVPGAFFDVFRNVGHPDARALSDSAFIAAPDQIFSLFARWVIPRFGLESYIEWARTDPPLSLHDFFEQPNHSRGYTAGLQWTRADWAGQSRFRVMGEITNVEQSSTFRFRPIGSYYTSRSVPQGFTNEGQVLGAGIGPGSSGSYFAADYFRGAWRLGASLGRTRFNNDAFFLLPGADRCGHDVTLYPGIRGSYASHYMRIGLAFVSASRYNTFFQNIGRTCVAGGDGSDRHNNSVSLTVATFGW